MTHYDPEEWLAAEAAVKDVLGAWYASGKLDVLTSEGETVEGKLIKLSQECAKAGIRTVNHHLGSEPYYESEIETQVI